MTRVKHLTPRKKYLHQAVVDYKKTISVLNRRHLITKKKLMKANNFIKEHGLLIEKMNKTSINFFKTQISAQSVSPRGRRFSIDDKIFALSLYKCSAKSYRLLSKTFALPSRKTLMGLLHQLPLETGINDQIFIHLKDTVSGFKNELDKNCVLLFDEISLAAGIHYCQVQDKIVGVEDLGNDRRRLQFADKAITFMVRGIKLKFKQPVAFYFTKSGMKTPDLVVVLKEVIRAVQSTGLKIIATVCDQAPTNVAAIHILLRETTEIYNRRNTEKRSLGFEIDGQEIVPLYDPPHLLKGIRNNLITKDLVYYMNGEKKIAKWSHIVQFYEIDKIRLDVGERMTPKLTDTHIYPDKIRKMKVSVAAQVFSQRVGSIMLMLSEWSG